MEKRIALKFMRLIYKHGYKCRWVKDELPVPILSSSSGSICLKGKNICLWASKDKGIIHVAYNLPDGSIKIYAIDHDIVLYREYIPSEKEIRDYEKIQAVLNAVIIRWRGNLEVGVYVDEISKN